MKIKKFGATEQLVYDLAKPVADEKELQIWDVRFEKEGASWYLRVFIDKESGITIDDCEALSRPLSDLLDEKDPISQGYFLEVGSAGLERDLLRQSHFETSIGKLVKIKMIRPIEGVRDFIAELSDFDKEKVVLSFPVNYGDDGGGTKEIPLADIAHIKLYDDFNNYL